MLPTKRRKLTPRDNAPGSPASGSEDDAASGSVLSSDNESDASTDTEDEIAEAKTRKSKKTLKRKRRATDASRFGETLQSLLSTKAPSALPLSLKPSIARKRVDEKLELKGKRVLQVEKKDKEDNGRIRDVIGGWGGEGERALRKVAQRGVVKLFNAIQQSQAASSAAADELKTQRGSGKPTLPAPTSESKSKSGKKSGRKANVPDASLTQDDFLDIIRGGGLVSKS
ncbi:Rrp15p-domain-containing protein [Amylocystis lapponica]|nr:Rrp15p-domain-containing protein [Amylocystis lapponica]